MERRRESDREYRGRERGNGENERMRGETGRAEERERGMKGEIERCGWR